MDTQEDTTPQAHAQEAIGDATTWFRGCTNQEEVDAQLEAHRNACRWEVLTVHDFRGVKNEYAALSRIIAKDAARKAGAASRVEG